MRIPFARVCLVVALASGCAKGGAALDDAGGPTDAATHHDAHPQTVIPDASTPADSTVVGIDASVMVDAAPLGPDASTDGNLCTDNNQCTDAGECCVSITGIGFCAPGIIIGATCLPS